MPTLYCEKKIGNPSSIIIANPSNINIGDNNTSIIIAKSLFNVTI